ncbi:MAG: hypothetical protein RL368_639 [Pseudomonadota bacterium]
MCCQVGIAHPDLMGSQVGGILTLLGYALIQDILVS